MDIGTYIGLGQFPCWYNMIHRAWLYVLGKTSLIDLKGNSFYFVRNSIATFTDFEGLVKTATIGGSRIEQLRRVENLISEPEDFTQPEWVKTDGTATTDLLTSTAAGATFLQEHTAVAGDYVFTVDLKRKAGASFVKITCDGSTYETLVISGNKVWQRFTTKQTLTAGTKNAGIQLSGDANQVYARRAQLEFVGGQANQNPSEYTESEEYYNYQHANTVVSKQVVEARGVDIITLQGILLEDSTTNYVLDSEHFASLINWSKSSVTVASNSIAAPDGVVTADTLTSIGSGAFVRQSKTLSVNDWTFSVWLKRKTGIGNISLSLDNGVTTAVVPVTAQWDRYFVSQASVTNPALQIIISTSGDAVYAWGAQLETADFLSSYMKTEAATASRVADELEYELGSGNFPQSFQLGIEVIPLADGDKYATTDFRLFSTEDVSGSVDEVSTIGHADTYGYTHATGGGAFQLSQADFIAGVTASLVFILSQQGGNVRAVIKKDDVVKYDNVTAGTLNHSDTGVFQIGRWGSDHFSGHFKNIKLWSA